jgi:nitroreductase
MTQVSTQVADPSSVNAAMLSRFSCRAYSAKPVERSLLQDLLQTAARAPSGTNTQPWKVYVLQGASKDSLIDKVVAQHNAQAADPGLAQAESYDYYPEKWVSPFIDRRRACGFGLYGVLGIAKGDKAAMHHQQQQNFRFFGAPVGLIFTLDKVMGRGSLVDYGMFLQNIMLAARARGLHTCPQAAWNGFSNIILPHVGAADNELLVCGMSMGYADESALVNTFQTERESAETFTTWLE